MSDDAGLFEELDALLLGKLAEDELSAGDVDRLDEILKSNPRARQRYRRITTLQALLRWRAGGIWLSVEDDSRMDFEFDNLHAPTLHEAQILPALEETYEGEEAVVTAPGPVSGSAAIAAAPSGNRWWQSRILSAGIAAAIFLTLGIGIVVMHHGREVARISAVAAGEWDDGGAASVGVGFAKGRSLRLASGAIELTFQNGAAITMAGPVSFTLDDSMSVTLLDGSLSANVPHSAPGFRVHTPVMTVTDLGTEFGVKYDPKSQDTEVRVFQGKVTVAVSDDAGHEQQLSEGMAARVAGGVVSIDSAAAQPQLFVRNLALSIPLASRVAQASGSDAPTSPVTVFDGDTNSNGGGWVVPKVDGNSIAINPDVSNKGKKSIEFKGKGKDYIGAGWNWCGWAQGAGTDISHCKRMSFYCKIDGPSKPTDFSIALRSNNSQGREATNVNVSDYIVASDPQTDLDGGQWVHISIPLADLCGDNVDFDPAKAWEFDVGEWSSDPMDFSIYFDTVQFVGEDK